MSTFTDSQKAAIAARGNVLVSAGAGTGKTRTVVERCLRLIVEEGCSLENILMVTFTEAAAAEMRARLRKELEKLAAPDSAIRAPLSALEEQLALLDTAHISTLHSFCLHLVREEFHRLELDPQVSVLDDSQAVPLRHEALDAVLRRCYERKLPGADEMLALIRRAGGSDDPVRALVLKLHDHIQSRPDAAAWFARQTARLQVAEPDEWRVWLGEEVLAWRNRWLPELKPLDDSPNISRCIEVLTPSGPNGIDRAAFRAWNEIFQQIIAIEDSTWPRSHPKKDFHKPVEAFFDDARFFNALTRQDGGIDPLKQDWDWMRRPMLALLELAQEFAREFARAKRAQGGLDFSDLEQFALRLLVDDHGAPTEVARAWQARFTHVFVDECQDINAAQDAIICAVAQCGRRKAEGETAHDADPIPHSTFRIPHSGNRFLVGDVKQSIYRFRLAAPEIFRDYERQWRAGGHGTRIPLADNFRSREGILDFVNAVFSELMREELGGIHYDDDARLRFGAPDRRAQLNNANGNGPRVELHVIHKVRQADDAENEEAGPAETAPEADDLLSIEKEARLVAQRLREIRESRHEIWDEDAETMRPVAWRDMVVLLRSPRSRVEAFAKEFSKAGVPLAVARAGFYGAIEVQDLLNLLRLLDNPRQDIPLVAVLRSPLVAMSLDELAALRIAGGRRDAPFFEVATRPGLSAAAGDRFAEVHRAAAAKAAAFQTQLLRWRTLMRQTSLSHCLETVLSETGCEALLLAGERGRERVANVRRLLELARQYDPFQRQGLYRFLRFIEQQEDAELDQDAAVVETGDAVRLMSIHKSKGLEFPVVALACLGGQFNFRDLSQDILLDLELGLCAKVMPPDAEQRYPSLPWRMAERRERRELTGEELRLFYVAMTRARDTLILTGFDKSKAAGQPWGGGTTVTDKAIADAKSFLAWMRLWLDAHAKREDWTSQDEGGNGLLKWWHYAETNERFRGSNLECRTTNDEAEGAAAGADSARADQDDEALIDSLPARVHWRYEHDAATRETAKTHVTALRRRAAQEDEEARPLFRFRARTPRDEKLSAAEIGSAHHTFLQHVGFARTATSLDLKNEAERMVREGTLTREEAARLDFRALLAFWESPEGKTVREADPRTVHRELPFTARFTTAELRELGLCRQEFAAEEFIIVQGVVDLAIIRADGILVIDFKTDHLDAGEIDGRAQEYRPQLQLYGAALHRIHGRPVAGLHLHFLSCGRTIPVESPARILSTNPGLCV